MNRHLVLCKTLQNELTRTSLKTKAVKAPSLELLHRNVFGHISHLYYAYHAHAVDMKAKKELDRWLKEGEFHRFNAEELAHMERTIRTQRYFIMAIAAQMAAYTYFRKYEPRLYYSLKMRPRWWKVPPHGVFYAYRPWAVEFRNFYISMVLGCSIVLMNENDKYKKFLRKKYITNHIYRLEINTG